MWGHLSRGKRRSDDLDRVDKRLVLDAVSCVCERVLFPWLLLRIGLVLDLRLRRSGTVEIMLSDLGETTSRKGCFNDVSISSLACKEMPYLR